MFLKRKRSIAFEKQVILNDFTQDSCTTISNGYAEIKVNDYEHLSVIQFKLLSTIKFLSELIPTTENKEELFYSIETVTEILLALNIHDECLGLTELLQKLEKIKAKN